MNLADAARNYEDSTLAFLREADRVTDENIDRHVAGGWSARQIIHHVADSETQSYLRLRRLLAEPAGSLIQGYDEAAWARCHALGYEELPVENSLRVIAAVRAASSDVLGRLAADDLDRWGEHSETGRYTLRTWLDTYTRHPRDHAEQLNEAVNA